MVGAREGMGNRKKIKREGKSTKSGERERGGDWRGKEGRLEREKGRDMQTDREKTKGENGGKERKKLIKIFIK